MYTEAKDRMPLENGVSASESAEIFLERSCNFINAGEQAMMISIGQGGEGLGSMWGWETAPVMFEQAGLALLERPLLEHDPVNIWFLSSKERSDVS